MRNSKEMFGLFNGIAASDERIRAMTLEGSRVNPSVTPDIWQDYDITFLVTETESFLRSDDWLAVFGERIFMQKPEAMELFPPDFPSGWFSYLMLFDDGVKIDLTIVPVSDIKNYFEQDPLICVLLDKDGICPKLLKPSDERFWVQKPCEAFVSDCANEFLFVCTYVAKGLLRNEQLFANHMFESAVRKELLRMLGYLAGARNGFPVNTGKHNKWLPRFLSEDERSALSVTYNLSAVDAAWNALYTAMRLFQKAEREVCAALGYEYSDETLKIKEYIEVLKGMK